MAENIYEDPDLFVDLKNKTTAYEVPDVVNEMNNYIKFKPEEQSSKGKKELDMMENVSLNIAVTGESGAGKSTFVNALRGLRDGDDGAAETGVTETTMKPIKYTHPSMPNVFIWDLPGIGTPNFKAKKYLKDVRFDTYDFFIIIGTVRFKENDIMLAKEIKKMKKMFYFVRSKIDNDLRAESHKRDFNEEQVLKKIRLSCRENLKDVGNANVFLISTFDLGKYDFQTMIDSLEGNLSEHKRSALIQSMPVCSLVMVEKKRKQLFKTAAAAAAAAASTAGIPIPGLSVGCEIGVMLGFFQKAHVAFGLDAGSIQRLSDRVNKPEAELKAAMTSRFAGGVDEKVVAKMLRTTAMISAKTVEAVLTAIPAFGNIGAMGLAFATTLHLLHEGIKEMTDDAKAVIVVAGL